MTWAQRLTFIAKQGCPDDGGGIVGAWRGGAWADQ